MYQAQFFTKRKTGPGNEARTNMQSLSVVDGDVDSDVDGQEDIPASMAHCTKYKSRLRVSHDYTADRQTFLFGDLQLDNRKVGTSLASQTRERYAREGLVSTLYLASYPGSLGAGLARRKGETDPEHACIIS